MFRHTLSKAVFATIVIGCSATAFSIPDRISAPAGNLSRLAALMPQSSLPDPIGQLKYVALGVGTQNYTCASDTANDIPGTTGAVATLFDIGTQLNGNSGAKTEISRLSGVALSLVNRDNDLNYYLVKKGYSRSIGLHFFISRNNTATPVFTLNKLHRLPHPTAVVKRINGTDAPKSAHPGLAREGAIPWVSLADIERVSVGGIDTVYRLETAGGKAPATCKGLQRTFEIKYTAQYWIFGARQRSP